MIYVFVYMLSQDLWYTMYDGIWYDSGVAEAVHINSQYDAGFGRPRVFIFLQIVYVYASLPVYACVVVADGKGGM